MDTLGDKWIDKWYPEIVESYEKGKNENPKPKTNE
jgi:hypothetical protein